MGVASLSIVSKMGKMWVIRQRGRFNQSNCIWDQDSGSLGFWDLDHAWNQHVESGVYFYRWFCTCMAKATDFSRFFLVVVTDRALIEPLLERWQNPWDSNGRIVSTWWLRRLFSSNLPSTVIGVVASQRQQGKDRLDLVFGPGAFSSVYRYSEARLFVMYNDWHNTMSIMSIITKSLA